jgi:hypothetical protein
MVFDGQMMDAGKFRKQLLSLSQGDLCGDCLAVVLNELDDAPKIGVVAKWDGTPIGCCQNCGNAKESFHLKDEFKDELNCPMWGVVRLNPYGFCHMWKPKE